MDLDPVVRLDAALSEHARVPAGVVRVALGRDALDLAVDEPARLLGAWRRVLGQLERQAVVADSRMSPAPSAPQSRPSIVRFSPYAPGNASCPSAATRAMASVA